MLKGNQEDNVLTLLCFSGQHAAALTLQLTADLFSTRSYRKLADTAIKYIQSYGTAPGIHMRDLLESDLRRGEEGQLLNHVIDDMEKLWPELQADYVLAELSRFIATSRLANAIEEAYDAVRAGDLEGAERALYSREQTLISSSGIWLHDAERMLGFMNQREEDFFPSGIEILDQRGVRPQRKEEFLIIGPKKIGKSWWAIQIGKESILNKKKVLHVTLENSEEITAKRYIQALFALTESKAEEIRVPVFHKDLFGRCTAIDLDNRTAVGITGDNKNEIARKLSGLSRRARLLIKEFPTGQLTIAQLNAFLDHLARAENFYPDLVIVDSGNRMSMRGDHIRTDMGQIFIGLRGIAVARNLALVTTTHSNRAGDLARQVSGAAHVGEDYSLLGTADIVCTISRTKAERQMGLARILVDAARNVTDQWISLISQNYATGQFALDSVYMNKFIEEEVDRFSGKEEDDAT